MTLGVSQVESPKRPNEHTNPSEPEHERSKADEGNVVRTEVHEFALSTSSENEGVREAANSGTDLDGASTSVIQDAPFLKYHESASSKNEA